MANIVSISSAPINSGATVTATKSGADNCLLFIGNGKASVTGATLSAVTHGTSTIVPFEETEYLINTIYGYAATSYALDANIDQTAQAATFTWSASMTEPYFGAVIVASGVDQTTPISTMGFQGFAAGAATARNYIALAGDIVVYVLTDTNSVATTTPAGFTRAYSGASGTSQLDLAEVCYKELTADESGTVIAGNIAGNSLGYHYVVIIKSGTPTVPLEAIFPVTGADQANMAYKVFDGHDLSTATEIDAGSTAAIVSNQVTLTMTGLAALSSDVLLVASDFTTTPTGTSEATVAYSTVTAV